LEACRDLVEGRNKGSATDEEYLERICLHVKVNNEIAIDMYEKAGFEIVGTDSFLTLLGGGSREHLMCCPM
jgi:ribosomal protein S18 acetylase RimI-like enzyme